MAYQTVPQLTIHPDRPCSRLLVCHRTGAGGKRGRSYLFNCVLRQRRSKICFFPNASVRENFVRELFNVKHQISCHRIVVIAIANVVYAIQADKSEDETDRKSFFFSSYAHIDCICWSRQSICMHFLIERAAASNEKTRH